MSNITTHYKYKITKAESLQDLDNQVNNLMNNGWELHNASHYVVDPETGKNVYYQVMVMESDHNINGNKLSKVKTFSADSSAELEKLVNEHLDNNDAVCIGSAYIANGKWVQGVRNVESYNNNNIKFKINSESFIKNRNLII